MKTITKKDLLEVLLLYLEDNYPLQVEEKDKFYLSIISGQELGKIIITAINDNQFLNLIEEKSFIKGIVEGLK
jgi:hypothetical protein